MPRKTDLAVDLMLDSGAFSAWNKGDTIDLGKYIEFIKRYKDLLYSYVTLDVLPPGDERKRTTEALDHHAKLSYENTQRMKDAGLSPIPVFHHGESMKWLEKMLDDGEPYIGISTRKDMTYNQVRPFLNEAWSYITDKQGRPVVKVHGFGITAVNLLRMYPWFTTDSTTWSLSAGYGQILVPKQMYHHGHADWDYLTHPFPLIVSGRQQQASGHLDRQTEALGDGGLGPTKQEHVDRWLRDVAGLTLTQVKTTADARRKAILTYYVQLAEHVRDIRFEQRWSGLSGDRLGVPPSKKKAVNFDHLRIMFATSLNKQFSDILTRSDARTRLLSYYELRKADPELIHRYVETGMPGPYVPKMPKPVWDNSYLTYRRSGVATRVGEHVYDGTYRPLVGA